MKKVSISDMKVENGKDMKRFSLRANGIPLAVTCTLKELAQDNKRTLGKINNSLRNSIRFIKLYGEMPPAPKTEAQAKALKKNMDKMLNVWASSDTGIAVRGNKLSIPEFQPFSF